MMTCKKCGNSQEKGKFCVKCGSSLINNITSTQKTEAIKVNQPEHEVFAYQPGQIAGAVRNKHCSEGWEFLCIDGFSKFYVTDGMIRKYHIPVKTQDYIWVKLEEMMKQDDYRYSITPCEKKKITKESETEYFWETHAEGDVTAAVIRKIDAHIISVQLGTKLFVTIRRAELPDDVNVEEFSVNDVAFFKVRKSMTGTVKLDWIPKYICKEDDIPKPLPRNLDKVTISSKLLDRLEALGIKQKLIRDQNASIENLRETLDSRYQEELHKGLVSFKQCNTSDPDEMAADFLLNSECTDGVPTYVGMRYKNENWTINVIDACTPERLFDRFVNVVDWKSKLESLAQLAKYENWNYPQSGKTDNLRLRHYIVDKFYKAWVDDLVYEEHNDAVFNTGLINTSGDEIFCYLKKNPSQNTKWEIEFFACFGNDKNGKKLQSMFSKKPKAPSYMPLNHSDEFFFDSSRDIVCDYEHIIKDNLCRLPLDFIEKILSYDKEMQNAIATYRISNADEDFKKIKSMVCSADQRGQEFCRYLKNGLEVVVKEAIISCTSNYRDAIAIYCPRKNCISLLLPLRFHSGENSLVDAALVVEKLSNGNYQGQTILTMQMAYRDARQLGRLDSCWLQIGNMDCAESTNEAA